MLADDLRLGPSDLEPCGDGMCKIRPGLRGEPRGRLVLVTAMTPTTSGEGKTTVAIGLADALRRLGARSVVCLRQPSMGPYFGRKGGGTGGGRAGLHPDERINLHFTGDMHAVGSAQNLLAAVVDNHIHFGNALGLDPGRLFVHRALDLNDRSLRNVVVGRGDKDGPAHEEHFDIVAASEVMAILSLASDYDSLQERLARIVVGIDREGRPVTALDLRTAGAMAVLLKEAIMPNLVQTLEGTPALVHGGPFANIAHGTSSVVATRVALAGAGVVVQEAGFAADLGAEKFVDIFCRELGRFPDLAVVVVTRRALALHGEENLRAHLEILEKLGLPAVVALNEIEGDEGPLPETPHIRTRAFTLGGAGSLELGEAVLAATPAEKVVPIYPMDATLEAKVGLLARNVYGAGSVSYSESARRELDEFQTLGFGSSYVCVAKTNASLSDDPHLTGRPRGFDFHVNSVRLLAGAGLVVPICGTIQTMPGLGRSPNLERFNLTVRPRETE